MKEYKRTRGCAKCGDSNGRVKCIKKYIFFGEYQMKRTCNWCKYAWKELPWDREKE